MNKIFPYTEAENFFTHPFQKISFNKHLYKMGKNSLVSYHNKIKIKIKISGKFHKNKLTSL